MVIPAGRIARVRVPATSANLGSGFDCMGLALDWYDELEAEATGGGLVFELSGEGAEQVPRDERHLVLASLVDGLADLGDEVAGLVLRAHNTIPHSRGLGSSAAAIVAGLALAWGLARPDRRLDLGWVDRLSSQAEGHPDNATAAVHGGAVLAWMPDDVDAAPVVEVVELTPVSGLRAIALVPTFEVLTSGARKVLPDDVPRLDAVRQATRSALLVHALTTDPARLLEATDDLLHQPYRAGMMRPSADLVAALRAVGVAAVISGAGPTVLALGTPDQLALAEAVPQDGFVAHSVALGRGVELLEARGSQG